MDGMRIEYRDFSACAHSSYQALPIEPGDEAIQCQEKNYGIRCFKDSYAVFFFPILFFFSTYRIFTLLGHITYMYKRILFSWPKHLLLGTFRINILL